MSNPPPSPLRFSLSRFFHITLLIIAEKRTLGMPITITTPSTGGIHLTKPYTMENGLALGPAERRKIRREWRFNVHHSVSGEATGNSCTRTISYTRGKGIFRTAAKSLKENHGKNLSASAGDRTHTSQMRRKNFFILGG